MATTPQAISAKLRREGYRPVADHRREGVRVSTCVLGEVGVHVQIDMPGREARMIAELEEVLATWEGYKVRHEPGSPFFYVSKIEK